MSHEAIPSSIVEQTEIRGSFYDAEIRAAAAEFAGNVSLVLVRSERLGAETFSDRARMERGMSDTPKSYAAWSIAFESEEEQAYHVSIGLVNPNYTYKTRKAALATVDQLRKDAYEAKCFELREEAWAAR